MTIEERLVENYKEKHKTRFEMIKKEVDETCKLIPKCIKDIEDYIAGHSDRVLKFLKIRIVINFKTKPYASENRINFLPFDGGFRLDVDSKAYNCTDNFYFEYRQISKYLKDRILSSIKEITSLSITKGDCDDAHRYDGYIKLTEPDYLLCEILQK